MRYYKLCSILLILFSISFSAQAQNDDLNVEIDAAADVDLSEYVSYFWVTDFANGEDIWITVNKIQGEMIKDALEYEMDVKGVKWSPENPDLLVNFHIFDEAFDENFYTGSSPYEYRYMEKQAMMEDIEDGTIVVTLVDKETGKSVWEGYATIGVEENEPLRMQQTDIRQAISGIFDRYNPEGLTETSSLR